MFYSTIYEYGRYYPNFSELESLVSKYAGINAEWINIEKIKFKDIHLLDVMVSHKCMLEYMDIYCISFNDMLKIFINSNINNKREEQLYKLGFGENFLSSSRIIFKFIEKFARYTIKFNLYIKPKPRDLKDLDIDDYIGFNKLLNKAEYESDLKELEKRRMFNEKIQTFPYTQMLFYNSDIFSDDTLEIWMYNDAYNIGCYEYIDQSRYKDQTEKYIHRHGRFLKNFDFKKSINYETKQILDDYLKKCDYDDEKINVNKKDVNELTRTYNDRSIDDKLFLHEIYKFTHSINLCDEILDSLKKLGIPTTIVENIIKYYIHF